MDILTKVSIFAPENCLRTIKQSIVPLATLMKKSHAAITLIENQWNKVNFVEWQNVSSTGTLWAEILSYRDASGTNPFQNLAELAIQFLVLPWSNGEVERVFSQMNLVKNHQRNKMEIGMLNAILCIRAGLRRKKKCCKDYTFPTDVLAKIGTMAAYDDTPASRGSSSEEASSEGKSTGSDYLTQLLNEDDPADNPDLMAWDSWVTEN